jgi:putative ABC transport system permease protein
MSVMERLQEIGILKSMGAMARDIFRLIWLETLILCISGGIIGTIFAMGTAKVTEILIRRLLPYAPSGGLVQIDLGLVLLTFAVVTLIGLLSGIYPSWKAGRVRPLEAIRSQVES